MRIKKRATHPVLAESEKLIEAWRRGLIVALRLPPEVAAYLLVLRACIEIHHGISIAARAADSHGVIQIIRSNLFGLQFGLQSLANELPSSSMLCEEHIADSTDKETLRRVGQVLEGLKTYSMARDVFLAYYYGAFDLKSSKPKRLAFVDAPSWPGHLDFAEQFLAADTKRARCKVGLYPPTLDSVSEFPPHLDLGVISSRIFLKLWSSLARLLFEFFSQAGAPVVTRSEIINRLCNATDADQDCVNRFIDLLTFDPSDRRVPA